MVQNLITLINKPAIELSVVDKMMIYGYAIVAGIILLSLIILIWWIIYEIKQKTNKKEERQLCIDCKYNKQCTIEDRLKLKCVVGFKCINYKSKGKQ